MIRTEPTLSTSAPAVCRRPIELCPVGACQPCDTLRGTREASDAAYRSYIANERGQRDPQQAVEIHQEGERAYTRYLRGLGSATALLLSLTLCAPTWAAETPKAPAKPRVKPAVSIAVKVYTDGRVPAGQVKISTADADSCVAWIGEDKEELQVKALRQCRAEISRAAGTQAKGAAQ